MVIKAHMLVTRVFFDGETKHSDKLINQMEEWLKGIKEVSDNVDKIGCFLYTVNGEPTHDDYSGVKFFMEIDNGPPDERASS